MFQTFCACGRRAEYCDGSRAGCSGWYDSAGSTPLDVRGVTSTVPRSSSATNMTHPGPMIVWVGEPALANRDQRNFDRRTRLKRERDAADRKTLARRGRGK